MTEAYLDAWMCEIGKKRVAAHISVHVGETNTSAIRAKINGSVMGALAELDRDVYRAACAALIFVENIRDHGVHAETLAEYTTYQQLVASLARVTA